MGGQMSRKRGISSAEALVNVLFTFIYIAYWWLVLQQIFQGSLYLIYVSIVPFILMMYVQSLTIKGIERKRERQLMLSVEKSVERYNNRVKV